MDWTLEHYRNSGCPCFPCGREERCVGRCIKTKKKTYKDLSFLEGEAEESTSIIASLSLHLWFSGSSGQLSSILLLFPCCPPALPSASVSLWLLSLVWDSAEVLWLCVDSEPELEWVLPWWSVARVESLVELVFWFLGVDPWPLSLLRQVPDWELQSKCLLQDDWCVMLRCRWQVVDKKKRLSYLLQV